MTEQETLHNASHTDWELLVRLEDDELDTTDIPDPTPEQLERAIARQALVPPPDQSQ